MITSALVSACRDRFESHFKPSREAVTLIARIRYVARVMPSLLLPDVSDSGLKALLPEICEGKRTLHEVEKGDWQGIILAHLSFQTKRTLDTAFPERVTVPSGSAIRINYSDAAATGEAPVLACRLQELFGITKTPAIVNGTVPLTLHLLAPNGRPCQVTRDLASFWQNTYPSVRKDLRGRYPKHYWPEDPFSATATRKIRPAKG
jgi:ATP-dependent helicase HrpB